MIHFQQLLQSLCLFAIKGYQRISWLWPKSCRFYPSCSCYAHQAIIEYGAFSGIGLTAKRLLKCHPLNPGGIDLVPAAKQPIT